MKTLLTLLLLIPSLSWGKNLLCEGTYSLKYDLNSFGVVLNDNSKKYHGYEIGINEEGNISITKFSSDNDYLEKPNYLIFKIYEKSMAIDRKNLTFGYWIKPDIMMERGNCYFVDNEEMLVGGLMAIINYNIDNNKI